MIALHDLPNKRRGEKPILFLRRHWFAVIEILGFLLVFIFVPIMVLYIANIIDLNIFSNPFWGPFTAVFLSGYAFIVLTIVMTQFTDFFLDTWIVSTERIINIEQNGLFSRTVATLNLNQVQDVTAETEGFIPTIFSYGNVYIQTAGTRERFNFKQVDNPEMVKATILKLIAEDKNRRGDESQIVFKK